MRALHALQALTKSKAGSDGVQNAFREVSSSIPISLAFCTLPSRDVKACTSKYHFPAGMLDLCVVAIMGGSQGATEEGTEEHVAKCKAVEGFFFLCRNNAESR